MDNKKFLTTVTVVFAILAILVIIPTVNNLKDLGYLKQETDISGVSTFEIEEETLSADELSYIKEMESEIADYKERTSTVTDTDVIEKQITRTLTELCDILCYEGSEGDNVNPMPEIQENIQKYVTAECYKNDILTTLNFKDSIGNFSKFKLLKIAFADLDTDTPKALGISYFSDRKGTVYQLMDCEFVYDKTTEDYLIKKISFIRE